MPTLVPDPAQIATDDLLHKIELRTHAAYKQAAEEMAEKVQRRLANFEKARKKTEEQLLKGEITDTEYRNWLLRQTAMNQDLKEMAEVLAKDLHKTNLIAAGIARDGMADVYAVNANYAHFDIIQQAIDTGKTPLMVGMNLQDAFWDEGLDVPFLDAGFTLYNHDTAALLLRSEWAVSPETGKNALLPKPSAKKKKELKKLAQTNPDVLWNQQKLQSAILQGVLQGEAMTDLARRLGGVAVMNENQAIRNARTMTTNVQNMGRQQAYQNAKDKDIKLQIVWYATLDSATRHSHRMLHGEAKPNNKTAKFSNGCRWPGDPNGPPEEVYNCRCTTVSWVEGYEQDTPHDSEWLKQQQLDFEDWKKGMNKAPNQNPPTPATGPTVADPFESAIRNAREYSPAEHEQDNFGWDFWNDDLTAEERSGIKEYTGSAYENMNGLLRGTVDWNDRSIARNPARWKYAINDCTDALSHRGLANDTKLYRGMGSNRTLGRALGLGESTTADQIHDLVSSGNIKGMRFVEKRFCSTGVNPASGWDKQVVMEITAPKGTKGFYVDPVSSCRGEEECLLQRGAIFRIHDAEYINGGVLKLHVVVEGTEPLSPI